MSRQVIVTPEAERQIRTIEHWWRNNRPSAADLFLDELAHCFTLLEQAPEIGRLYRRHPTLRGLRRILLRTTRCHVYYIPRTTSVTVLAVWHSQRGQLPPL